MITVFVDASHCPTTKAAGWGAWYKYGQDLKQGLFLGGAFRLHMRTASDAEICAIANALHVIADRKHMTPNEAVMIQSDCLHALNLIKNEIKGTTTSKHKAGADVNNNKSFPKTPREKDAIDRIAVIVQNEGVKLVVRHVKGHKDKATGRGWVNDQCDIIAKGHMRTRRAEKRKPHGY